MTIGSDESNPVELSAPIIGDDMRIGAAAILIDGITVGDGARIDAGAVVTNHRLT